MSFGIDERSLMHTNEAISVIRKFAFGHDSLLPLSESFTDDRNGWGKTIFSAFLTDDLRR